MCEYYRTCQVARMTKGVLGDEVVVSAVVAARWLCKFAFYVCFALREEWYELRGAGSTWMEQRRT